MRKNSLKMSRKHDGTSGKSTKTQSDDHVTFTKAAITVNSDYS